MDPTTIKTWGRGILGATIAGGANGISVLIADPVNFNFTSMGGFKKLSFVVGISAAVGAALYLKQHPLPEDPPESPYPPPTSFHPPTGPW